MTYRVFTAIAVASLFFVAPHSVWSQAPLEQKDEFRELEAKMRLFDVNCIKLLEELEKRPQSAKLQLGKTFLEKRIAYELRTKAIDRYFSYGLFRLRFVSRDSIGVADGWEKVRFYCKKMAKNSKFKSTRDSYELLANLAAMEKEFYLGFGKEFSVLQERWAELAKKRKESHKRLRIFIVDMSQAIDLLFRSNAKLRQQYEDSVIRIAEKTVGQTQKQLDEFHNDLLGKLGKVVKRSAK